MHTTKSLKEKKYHIIFSYIKQKKKSKISFSMYFGLNNQFIKAMRTWSIFHKTPKKYFIFF
jgi:hypothetical protein